MDKDALLSVRNSHAVERPGSHCGIVLPWTAGAGGLLSPFVAGRFDLSAVVCSSRLSCIRIISPRRPAGFPALTIRQDDRKGEACRRRQCQLAQIASLIEGQSGGLRVRGY